MEGFDLAQERCKKHFASTKCGEFFYWVIVSFRMAVLIYRQNFICILSNVYPIIYLMEAVPLCDTLYIYIYIQGVPGGKDLTSGECSLC